MRNFWIRFFVLSAIFLIFLGTYTITSDGMNSDSIWHCNQIPTLIEVVTPIRLIYCKLGQTILGWEVK